jgi:hypothetical protein
MTIARRARKRATLGDWCARSSFGAQTRESSAPLSVGAGLADRSCFRRSPHREQTRVQQHGRSALHPEVNVGADGPCGLAAVLLNEMCE